MRTPETVLQPGCHRACQGVAKDSIGTFRPANLQDIVGDRHIDSTRRQAPVLGPGSASWQPAQEQWQPQNAELIGGLASRLAIH